MYVCMHNVCVCVCVCVCVWDSKCSLSLLISVPATPQNKSTISKECWECKGRQSEGGFYFVLSLCICSSIKTTNFNSFVELINRGRKLAYKFVKVDSIAFLLLFLQMVSHRKSTPVSKKKIGVLFNINWRIFSCKKTVMSVSSICLTRSQFHQRFTHPFVVG